MKFSAVFFLLIISLQINAQQDSSGTNKRIPADTVKTGMNSDAIFERPFLASWKAPVAIGGYFETNTQYMGTDGVTDGFSFQFRRLTVFLSSSIGRKIKFLTEIEFEDGTKEINIEHAALDFEFHPLLNLRGGIIMNPIGAFNQNHDGPRWDFIDRPVSATGIIPATLSNAGFGIHGKYFTDKVILGYEAYLTNGFDERIIDNEDNRTSLAAGKSNPEKFEESNSGLPAFTGKLALKHTREGEIGLSYFGGVYNKWKKDGVMIDKKRKVSIYAFDFNTIIAKQTHVTGEIAYVIVDIPSSSPMQYGSEQWGGFIDLVQPVYKGSVLKFEKSILNFCFRFEYVDYNTDPIENSYDKLGDDIIAFVPGISFRPGSETVIRLNYRFHRSHDFLNNPPSRTGGIQFGLSSYF